MCVYDTDSRDVTLIIMPTLTLHIWPQFSSLCFNTTQSIVVMHDVVTMSCAMMSYGWMLGFCECVQW